MGKGFSKRKKQAKMMREHLSHMQDQMEQLQVTGSAGNGLVEVTLNGDYEIKALKIKPDCVDPEDVEGLEDLISAAHRDALKKLKKEMPSPPGMGGIPDLSGFGL